MALVNLALRYNEPDLSDRMPGFSTSESHTVSVLSCFVVVSYYPSVSEDILKISEYMHVVYQM